MALMLAHFEMDDYETWKRERFDADPAGRRQSAKNHVISRGVDDPSQVFVRVEFGSAEEAASFRERLMATAFILNTRNKSSEFNVFVSNNPGRGRGGTCFGDSGGPLLYADTDIILGVTSFGTNGNCAGTGYYYRIDQPDVLAWIVENADGPVTIVPLP